VLPIRELPCDNPPTPDDRSAPRSGLAHRFATFPTASAASSKPTTCSAPNRLVSQGCSADRSLPADGGSRTRIFEFASRPHPKGSPETRGAYVLRGQDLSTSRFVRHVKIEADSFARRMPRIDISHMGVARILREDLRIETRRGLDYPKHNIKQHFDCCRHRRLTENALTQSGGSRPRSLES